MNEYSGQEIRNAVRETYAKVANNNKEESAGENSCCSRSGCCSGDDTRNVENVSMGLGYTEHDLVDVPEGANMGLGCGNPQAIASLKDGETVLDLGSGGGFDVFLASRQIGESGKAIGVDFTPDMIEKARRNTAKGSYKNVEFRLGEIENLPIADSSIDVIISNCVINLSTDKAQVFRECYRVLRSGGRLAISDIVAKVELPDAIKNDIAMTAGCIAGAMPIEQYRYWLDQAGFTDIRITPKTRESKSLAESWETEIDLTDFVVSANIEAIKP